MMTDDKKTEPLQGEGDYAAARHYDRDTQDFITKNRGKIEGLAKDAAAALDGPEGPSLREAEREGRAHAMNEDPEKDAA
jgi:hypothetical protein